MPNINIPVSIEQLMAYKSAANEVFPEFRERATSAWIRSVLDKAALSVELSIEPDRSKP